MAQIAHMRDSVEGPSEGTSETSSLQMAVTEARVVPVPVDRPAQKPLPVQSKTEATLEAPPEANRSRKKAKLFGIGLLVVLAGIVAWYPLSDRYAPFAGGASVTAQITQVAPRVSGPVKQLLIADNAAVKAGQPLFEIDNTSFLMDVAQARGQLDQAMNSVASGVAAIPAAQAKLEQAQVALTLAQQDRDRARTMLERGFTSQAKFNTVESTWRTAQLSVEAAQADLTRIQTAASTADANNPNVRAAQAAVDKAEFALANTTVVAPTDGYVSNLSLAEGQFVAAGTPALTFIDPSTEMVIADLRENQLVNVEPGDKAVVMFEAAPGQTFDATVDSVAWGINSGRTSVNGLAQSSNDTRWFPPARKIPVRVTLNDMSQMPANVRLGSEASVLIIPQDGIVPAISNAIMGLRGLLSGFN
ncbi:MAG: HlyD family secretion protein [Alphaproteobacteria bacterium]|nr:HlyD family secretion protein [Alphaproteobacteria bacterium]